jgi:hypothetical protein
MIIFFSSKHAETMSLLLLLGCQFTPYAALKYWLTPRQEKHDGSIIY